MVTQDNQNCSHDSIIIEIEQEEIQEYDIDVQKVLLTKVYDDVDQSEPIKVMCSNCRENLNYEDLLVQKIMVYPLLEKESIDILSFINQNRSESNDLEDCTHEEVALELYQIIEYILFKENGQYKLKETNFKGKEIYLICQLCSTVLYEKLENIEQSSNDLQSDHEEYHNDLVSLDEQEDEDDNFDSIE